MNALEFYGALWRHKLFILAMTAIFVVVAAVITARQPKTYDATSLVRVQQAISDPGQALGALAATAQLAQTYARIVGTSTIADKIVQDSHGSLTRGDVAGHLSGSPVAGLDLLNITAHSRSPRIAQLIANAAPHALRRFIKETGTLRDQITPIQAAGVPSVPTSPDLKLNVALALLVGLIVNGALALLIDFLGDRVGDPDELEKLVKVPVLATIPPLKFARTPVSRGDLIDPGVFEASKPKPRSVERALGG